MLLGCGGCRLPEDRLAPESEKPGLAAGARGRAQGAPYPISGEARRKVSMVDALRRMRRKAEAMFKSPLNYKYTQKHTRTQTHTHN